MNGVASLHAWATQRLVDVRFPSCGMPQSATVSSQARLKGSSTTLAGGITHVAMASDSYRFLGTPC